MSTELPELIRPAQFARHIGINVSEVYKALHRGELNAYRKRGYCGRKGSYLIEKEQALEFFNAAYEVYAGRDTDEDKGKGGR